MTTSQILSGILIAVVAAVVIATVGLNAAVMVCLGVAVAMWFAAFGSGGSTRAGGTR